MFRERRFMPLPISLCPLWVESMDEHDARIVRSREGLTVTAAAVVLDPSIRPSVITNGEWYSVRNSSSYHTMSLTHFCAPTGYLMTSDRVENMIGVVMNLPYAVGEWNPWKAAAEVSGAVYQHRMSVTDYKAGINIYRVSRLTEPLECQEATR